MPDTANPSPIQQKQQRLTLAFLYASKGEAILKQLGEEKSYADVFPAATAEIIRSYNKGSLKKENYAEGDFIDQVIKPVMEDFLDVACPTAKGKVQIAQWVFKQYLSHRQKGRPMKASDLHKIAENITYFDKLKGSEPFKKSGAKPDLLSYKTYAAFDEMLTPYLERKAKNKKHSATFKVSTEEKASVLAETTMLYDGPEGKVVVPHTSRASIYWGANTKWCISGNKWRIPGIKLTVSGLQWGRIQFPGYNKKSPIIILIPKGRQDNKVVLVDKILINSTDHKIEALPQAHSDLMEKCLASLSEGARKGLEPWIPKGIVAEADNSVPAGIPHIDPALQESVIKELDDIKASRKKPDAALWSSRGFVTAAVRQDASALKYASRKLRKNRDFVTGLLEECDELPFNIAGRKKGDVVTSLLAEWVDFSFNPTYIRGKMGSMRKVIKRQKKVWQPGETQLAVYKVHALERLAEKGDMEKFVNYSRRDKTTWGDAETLLAADPAATVRKIEAAKATKPALLSRLRP